MKLLFNAQQVTQSSELDLLIEKFCQTHEASDLKSLLTYCYEHSKTAHFAAMTQCLHKIQGSQFIKKAEQSELLYDFAIKMIPLTLGNQSIKLCVSKMLRISRSYTVRHRWGILSQKIFHPQRSFDYLYWKMVRLPESPEKQFKHFFVSLSCFLKTALNNEISNPLQFLQLLIVSLYRCLGYSNLYILATDLKFNKFSMLVICGESFDFYESITSEQLEKMLGKIPKVIHPNDLTVAAALLDDQNITYQLLGFRLQIALPIDSDFRKVIKKILESKLIPIIMQNQSAYLTEMSISLSIVPLVLIKLIYEYYQEINFLNVEIAPYSETQGQRFKLFYRPNTSQEQLFVSDVKDQYGLIHW